MVAQTVKNLPAMPETQVQSLGQEDVLLLLSCFSHVRLCATPWTAAYQAPPSMGFSRQEYWSGVPSPSPKGGLYANKKQQVALHPVNFRLLNNIQREIQQAKERLQLKRIQQAYLFLNQDLGFSGVSVVKNPPANAGDADLIPGSGRSPGEGNGNPLQYSCLENSMDGGAWQATHGVAKSRT